MIGMAGKNIGMYKVKVEMGRDYYGYRKEAFVCKHLFRQSTK
jgi:hypothetical protein